MFLFIQNAVKAGVCRISGNRVEMGIHRIGDIEQWHRVASNVTCPRHYDTHKVDIGQQGVVDIASGKLALQSGRSTGEVLELLIN
ncbi:hypothetical protein ACNKHT_01020 [Shigella flexneri]